MAEVTEETGLIRQTGGPLILALSTLLASCAAGPDYRPATVNELGVPQAYTSGPGAPLSKAELASWWQRFNDPALNVVVEQAIAANLDIAQAQARLRQAREATIQARADMLRNSYFRDVEAIIFVRQASAQWVELHRARVERQLLTH